MRKNNDAKTGANIKFKAYSAIMMTGMIAVLFLFNYFVSELDNKFNLSIDMSAQRLYSLSSASKEIINDLSEDIYIYTTESEDAEDVNTQELLKNYGAQSSKIHVKNIDIIKNPSVMDYYDQRAGNVLEAGVIIVSNKSDTNDDNQRYKIIGYEDIYSYNEETEEYDEFTAEKAITGAIKYVINPINQKVWLLDNHNTDDGINAAIEDMLEDENYQVEMLSILNGDSPLNPGDIVIIMAPESDLTETERVILDDFTDEGGRMLIGVDQAVNETEDIKNLLSLIEKYSIAAGEGIVKEADKNKTAVISGTGLSSTYIIADILQHDITFDFEGDNYKIVLGANPGYLLLQQKVNDYKLTVDAILMTSDTSYVQAWDGSIDSDDASGENTVVAALTKTADTEGTEDTKIIITAASSMFTDDGIINSGVYKNREFFISCVAWLGDGENNINIMPKQLTNSPLMIETLQQAYFIIAMVSVVIPLFIFLIGIIVFVKRNRL